MKIVGIFVRTVAVVAMAMTIAACDQMQEANKMVAEANSIIRKSNESSTKSAVLLKELFGEVNTIEDHGSYKISKTEKLDELLKLLEGSANDLSEAGNKFEAASKLNVSDKFRDYLSLKGQEIKKRSDHERATTDFVKGFQSENDPEKVNVMIGEFNSKSQSIIKEADGLMKQAEQIVKDNPNEFKGN